MREAIGMIELTSVGIGYQVQDRMLKSADVDLVLGRTICSGKYINLVTGSVAAVQASVEAGLDAAPDGVIARPVVNAVSSRLTSMSVPLSDVATTLAGTSIRAPPGTLSMLNVVTKASPESDPITITSSSATAENPLSAVSINAASAVAIDRRPVGSPGDASTPGVTPN